MKKRSRVRDRQIDELVVQVINLAELVVELASRDLEPDGGGEEEEDTETRLDKLVDLIAARIAEKKLRIVK